MNHNPLKDIDDLISDVSDKGYVPPRFRKAPFTDKLKMEYVNYLKKERKRLEKIYSNRSNANGSGVRTSGPSNE